MNGKLLDLSGKIDPALVKVLDAVCQVTNDLKVPLFIVGATARDFMLQPFEIRPGRATGDVDLAIRLQSWDDYEQVVVQLIDRFGFKKERPVNRFSLDGILINIERC